jgi:hypothetical protein
MANKVFCIGNGESRQSFDLQKLKSVGKIYGCNALYRDFKPDVLVAVDNGIMHEIYQSGYCQKNETWLRNWTKLPKMMFEKTVFGNVSEQEVNDFEKYDVLKQNKSQKEFAIEFVFHGSSLNGIVGVLRKGKDKEPEVVKKEINQKSAFVSWIYENDKSHSLDDLVEGEKDRGYAAGATAGRIALIQNKDVKEVYLIGHDLESNTHQINNMYKGTTHYGLPENKPIPPVNWKTQWKTLFCEYPHVNFFKVNPQGKKGQDNISKPVDEWRDVRNLQYLDFKTTLDKLGII